MSRIFKFIGVTLISAFIAYFVYMNWFNIWHYKQINSVIPNCYLIEKWQIDYLTRGKYNYHEQIIYKGKDFYKKIECFRVSRNF